jgi:hypothetical protein
MWRVLISGVVYSFEIVKLMSNVMMNRAALLEAIGTNPHDLYNEILYEMCRRYPNHTNQTKFLQNC